MSIMVRFHQSLPQTGTYGRELWTEARQHHQPFTATNPTYDLRGLSVQYVDTYPRIELFLRDLGITDFSLIAVVDADGRIEKWSSSSLRDVEEDIFSRQADLHVQYACGRKQSKSSASTTQGSTSSNGVILSETDPVNLVSCGHRQSSSLYSSAGSPGRRCLDEIENSDENESFMSRKRKCSHNQNRDLRHPSMIGNTIRQPSLRTMTPLIIGNETGMRAFYVQSFKDLQQSVCKVIAKAFVKLIEPRKQTNYPYTKGYDGAPKWWPLPSDRNSQDGVPHREPDHLLKPARIQLLVHILCLVINPNAEKPGFVRKVTVKSLEEVTRESLNTWYTEKDYPDNHKKRPIIKKIFEVANLHERYMKGEVDEITMVHDNSGSNTAASEIIDDEVDEGVKYDSEEENNHEAAATSSIEASPDGALVSSMNGSQVALHDPRSDPGFLQKLPVRVGYHQSEDHFNYEHHLQTPTLYTSQYPVYDQQTQDIRRGISYSIPVNIRYQSPAPCGNFRDAIHQSVHWQQPAQSMIATEHYAHQQPQSDQLATPQQLVQSFHLQMNIGLPSHSYQPPRSQ